MATSAELTAARTPEPEVRFKRVLGLPALVFFGLAYMVPLTVWTTYGIVTTSTGGHLPLAYTVTTIAMGLTAWSYGRMVIATPVAGSAYTYASNAFGRPLGFMVGWALLLDYIFLWTKLSGVAFEVGLAWLAVGLLYLVHLTRGFRKPPPAMYTGD